MQTIKIIDLLNKIANGEQPNHIKAYQEDWYWNNYDGYVTKSSLKTTPDAQTYLFNQYRLDYILNDEVEIIEEPKKIEKINVELIGQCDNWIRNLDLDKPMKDIDINPYIIDTIRKNTLEFQHKLNEIIDYINEVENGKLK